MMKNEREWKLILAVYKTRMIELFMTSLCFSIKLDVIQPFQNGFKLNQFLRPRNQFTVDVRKLREKIFVTFPLTISVFFLHIFSFFSSLTLFFLSLFLSLFSLSYMINISLTVAFFSFFCLSSFFLLYTFQFWGLSCSFSFVFPYWRILEQDMLIKYSNLQKRSKVKEILCKLLERIGFMKVKIRINKLFGPIVDHPLPCFFAVCSLRVIKMSVKSEKFWLTR